MRKSASSQISQRQIEDNANLIIDGSMGALPNPKALGHSLMGKSPAFKSPSQADETQKPPRF
jgi:hypothetical protein